MPSLAEVNKVETPKADPAAAAISSLQTGLGLPIPDQGRVVPQLQSPTPSEGVVTYDPHTAPVAPVATASPAVQQAVLSAMSGVKPETPVVATPAPVPPVTQTVQAVNTPAPAPVTVPDYMG